MADDHFIPPSNDIPSTEKNPLNKPIGIKASQKELLFIQRFKELKGNRTLAAKLVYDCQDDRSASAIGSKLAKKFGLLKPAEVVMPENQFNPSGYDSAKLEKMGINPGPAIVPTESKINHGGQHGRMEVLGDALDSGELSFRDMFNEMRAIAYCYRDKGVSIRALVQLKEWWDEAKRQRDQLNMAERDVVDVLSHALASVGRKEYVEILKINRQIRKKIIHERNKVLDVDAIVRDEQEKKLWTEGEALSYADATKELESDERQTESSVSEGNIETDENEESKDDQGFNEEV